LCVQALGESAGVWCHRRNDRNTSCDTFVLNYCSFLNFRDGHKSQIIHVL